MKTGKRVIIMNDNVSAMPKFVIIGQTWGGFLPAAEAYGAVLNRDISSRPILMNLMYYSMSRRWNRLPLPGCMGAFWHRIVFDAGNFHDDDDLYFIFCQNYTLSQSRPYLTYIRKKYRRAKLVFMFRDSVAGTQASMAGWWKQLEKYFDAGLTFNRPDAEKYGLLYTDYWPGLLPDKKFQPENASDVFFIGVAKDRLPRILSVYERLRGAGLKCDFWITEVPESEQKYSDVIHYNMPIPYDETCQRAMNTKCVLEILPFGQNYSSIRPLEIMTYRKKLLTTNLNAPSEWFYNPEIVQVFGEASEIDTDFIAKPLSPEDEHRIFDGMNPGDFGRFADFIISNVRRKNS